MNRFTLSLLVPLTLLAACGSSGKDDKLSDEDVEALVMSVDMPMATMFSSLFIFGFMAEFGVECPSITQDGDFMTVEGGCTDDEGNTWTGSFESHESGVTWTNFDFLGMLIDGTQTYGMDGSLVSNMTVSGVDDEGITRGMTYTDHKMTNFMTLMVNSFSENPEYDYATTGSVTIGELGTFAINGSVDHEGNCDQEPDAGSVSMTGDFTIEWTYDGADNCDGCVSWTSDDQSGNFCPDTGGDTGSWDTGW